MPQGRQHAIVVLRVDELGKRYRAEEIGDAVVPLLGRIRAEHAVTVVSLELTAHALAQGGDSGLVCGRTRRR